MTDQPIATISPSPVRRFISVAIVMLLGAMLIYMAFVTVQSGLFWQTVIAAVGVGVMVGGDKMRRATALNIHLTDTAISDSSGREICRLQDVVGIDRGAFAFKPANGFLLRLNAKTTRAWAPGLWWRFGRRVGIGGAIPSGQGKLMAEAIALWLAQHGRD